MASPWNRHCGNCIGSAHWAGLVIVSWRASTNDPEYVVERPRPSRSRRPHQSPLRQRDVRSWLVHEVNQRKRCVWNLNKNLSYRRVTARCVDRLKSCQLPRNRAVTTCMTSPEQIEVMKLKRYSKAMCNKHVHSTMTRSSRFRCLIGVINKPTTVELWISLVYRRLAVAKFSESTM